jgi:N-acyl-L-homoserine lactone synthetase
MKTVKMKYSLIDGSIEPLTYQEYKNYEKYIEDMRQFRRETIFKAQSYWDMSITKTKQK